MGRAGRSVNEKRAVGLSGSIFRIGGHCGLIGQLFCRTVAVGRRTGVAGRVHSGRILGNLRHLFSGSHRHSGRRQHVRRIAYTTPQHYYWHLDGYCHRSGCICCDGLLVCPSGAGKRFADQYLDHSRTFRLETGRGSRDTGCDSVVGPVDSGGGAADLGGAGGQPARSVSPVSRQTGGRQRTPQCGAGVFPAVAGGADGRQSGSAGPIADDVLLDDLRGDQPGRVDRARQRHHQFPPPPAGFHPGSVGGICGLHPDHAVDRQVVYSDHDRGGAVHL